jgi:hypothetical protein
MRAVQWRQPLPSEILSHRPGAVPRQFFGSLTLATSWLEANDALLSCGLIGWLAESAHSPRV